MHAALPTGDPHLMPVTREEAVALSLGLLSLIERHPWLGAHPLLLTYARLLLAIQAAPSENQISSLTSRLEQERAVAEQMTVQQRQLETLQEEVGTLQFRLEAAQQERHPNREAELHKVQTQVREYEQELSETKVELTNTKARETETRAQKAKLDRKVEELFEQLRQHELKGLKNQTDLQQTLKELTEEKEKTAKLQTKINLFTTMFHGIEFGATHPTYTFSNRKRVPCCPVCQGLNPAEVASHREAGHKKDCPFLKLRKLLGLE
jgi:DNA repair exonuclease SbcCD ATPase subunit